MPNGQTWEDYIEAENTGREQEKKKLFGHVLDDAMNKAPVFRRYKALLIMVEQLLSLKNLLRKAQEVNRTQSQKSQAGESSQLGGPTRRSLSRAHNVTAAFYHADDDTIRRWIQDVRRWNGPELAQLVFDFQQKRSDTVAAFEDDEEVRLHTAKEEFEDFRMFVERGSVQKNVWDAL